MTEFKKTLGEVSSIEEMLSSLSDDHSTPPPERLTIFSTLKERLEDELGRKVEKFQKRLSETDPVSGAPRYGESMTAKVIALAAKHQTLLQRLPQVEAAITADVSRHDARVAAETSEAQKLEAEERLREEARLRIRMAEEEEEKRRALATQSILDRHRERVAAEASSSREERQLAAERERERLAEEKSRRDQEAQELTRSVAVGAAGVEDGLRRIYDVCSRNHEERKTAVDALYQKVTAYNEEIIPITWGITYVLPTTSHLERFFGRRNIFAQILRNVARNPEDPRFRRVRRDNENFQRALGRFEGGIQILLASGFRMQVERGETVLVMNEPDLSEDVDGWTQWYANITEAMERLKLELDERF